MEDKTFGWNVEMQIKAVRAGARVVEVPVRYRPRIGASKISGTMKGSFLAGVKILYTIFKYGFFRLPQTPDSTARPPHPFPSPSPSPASGRGK